MRGIDSFATNSTVAHTRGANLTTEQGHLRA
jgi:hypothetical protein